MSVGAHEVPEQKGESTAGDAHTDHHVHPALPEEGSGQGDPRTSVAFSEATLFGGGLQDKQKATTSGGGFSRPI